MAVGFNVGGSLGVVKPDKSMVRSSTPRVFTTDFGDGYEQRLANGINNLVETYTITFNNRTKEDIDDITAFFATKGGVTAFNYIIPDSNNSGETTVKVICDNWSQAYNHGDYYSCAASFRRVYEA